MMKIRIPFKFDSWPDRWLVQRNPYFLILHRIFYLCTGDAGIIYEEGDSDPPILHRLWVRAHGF